jgi:hypothetical protein
MRGIKTKIMTMIPNTVTALCFVDFNTQQTRDNKENILAVKMSRPQHINKQQIPENFASPLMRLQAKLHCAS